MKMYLLATLALILSTIPFAQACNGIGRTDTTPPTYCRAYGCPNPPGPLRCRAYGCEDNNRTQQTALQVTTTEKVYDDGTNYNGIVNAAQNSAEALAKLQCGTKFIKRISDWVIGTSHPAGNTYVNFTSAKATFECLL